MSAQPIRSVLFGKLAVSTRFITEEQLQECLAYQRELESQGEAPPRLGEVLERKGYLTKNQVQIVLDSMAKTQKRRFGEIAMSFQFVSERQVAEGLELQALLEKAPPPEEITLTAQALVAYRRFFAQKKSHADRPKLGEALTALGHLRTHQVDAVVEEQSKVIVSCGECQASLNITNFEPGQKLRCAQCGSVLTVEKNENGAMFLQLPPRTGMFTSPVAPAVPTPMPAEGQPSASLEAPLRARAQAPEEDLPAWTGLPVADSEVNAPGARAPAAPAAPPAAAAAASATDALKKQASGADSQGPLPSRLGDFKLLQRLGEDSSSRVAKALQVSRDRVVALRVMRRSVMLDDAFREKFLEDARKAANLDHPNIRKIFSVTKIDERYCVAMEFLEGESVYSILQKEPAIPWRDAVQIMRPILQALSVAHKAGVVHGDVRPSNIMITADGTVKLANLGVSAKADDSVLKVSESGRVAPFYIAPECVTGDRPTDQRIDIYSVGATLFHMISGKPPFQGKSPFEVLVKVSTETIPPLKFFDPGVPDSLNSIVHRMLDPEPDTRYGTCAQVLEDLEAAVSSRPIPSAPATATPPPPKGPLVPVLVVVGILIAAGIGWRFYQATERSAAFEAARARATSARQSRVEFNTARAELKRFTDAWPGTSEAEEAERLVSELRSREDALASKELDDARTDVASLISAGKFGTAATRVNTLVFWTDPSPKLDELRKQIETEASKAWETVVADALKLAEDGKVAEADAIVSAAISLRALQSDERRAAELNKQLGAIKAKIEEQAKADKAERERKEAAERLLRETEAARKRWDRLSGDFDRALAKWDLAIAAKVVETPEAQQAGTQADRDRLVRISKWLHETKQAAMTSLITTHASWDGKPENDRRLRARINGVECRATSADEMAVTFMPAGGIGQAVLWINIEPAVVAEALRRGAEATKKPEHELAAAAWCAARAPGTEPEVERGLLESAERHLARTAEIKDDATPLGFRLALWAERLQSEGLERLRDLVAQSKFAEAAQHDRAFRNGFGRRPWSLEHAADLDGLQKSALLAGSPAERSDWSDFNSGPDPFKVSEGWKAANGVLAGNGKEETLTFNASGIEEIAFLFRFPKPDFRLVLTAGDADLRLEPSRPRFDLLVKREGSTPLQKALKEKGDELRARDWHLLRARFDGTNVTVWLDGEESGSMAMASRPDGFTLTLAGVSQTQTGVADLDCVLVKRK
ncbi:MAG: protein kinase [Planctomycetota bacterium]